MNPEIAQHPLGIITPQYCTASNFKLDCGAVLPEITLCYEMYGTLSPARDNAILIIHALSGSAHAAGYLSENDRKPGWWDSMIGPGKAFDTDRYCVISMNSLGSCYGSTGPTSINPATGKIWGVDFPALTIEDMTRASIALSDALGIACWRAVVGGSMGGMQLFCFARDYPDRLQMMIPIATSARTTPEMIAFNYVARRAIMDDPLFKCGHYDVANPPAQGLGIARMLGHISYLCPEAFESKFGRRFRAGIPARTYNTQNAEFDVEGYLDYQAKQFVARFDANTYLLIMRAIDYFDFAEKFDGDMARAFDVIKTPTLFISFDSDWLYSPALHDVMADYLRDIGTPVEHHVLHSFCGHDSFLIEAEAQTPIIQNFIRKYEK